MMRSYMSISTLLIQSINSCDIQLDRIPPRSLSRDPNTSLILYNSDDEVTSSTFTPSPPHVNMIDLTLNESRPLDESAVSEKSGDFSHSNTVILSQEPLHIQPRTSPMYILPQEKLVSSLLTRVAIGWCRKHSSVLMNRSIVLTRRITTVQRMVVTIKY